MAAAAALYVPNAAQASSECLPALIQDRAELDISTVEDLTRLAEISSLTENSRESGAAFGIKIKGIPVGFSQDNISDLVQSVTSKFRASYSRQVRLSFATQPLSRNSVMAYQACIDDIPATGTQLYAYDATDEYVTVERLGASFVAGPRLARQGLARQTVRYACHRPSTEAEIEAHEAAQRSEDPGHEMAP